MFEGAQETRTCVLVEYPSMEKATAFWNSPEYQAAIKMREGAAQLQVMLLDSGQEPRRLSDGGELVWRRRQPFQPLPVDVATHVRLQSPYV
ncbi:MAG: hypothetical protein ACI9DC_002210 [Gammaproteobacteria bacterium]|jgi:hypothetical protein